MERRASCTVSVPVTEFMETRARVTSGAITGVNMLPGARLRLGQPKAYSVLMFPSDTVSGQRTPLVDIELSVKYTGSA